MWAYEVHGIIDGIKGDTYLFPHNFFLFNVPINIGDKDGRYYLVFIPKDNSLESSLDKIIEDKMNGVRTPVKEFSDWAFNNLIEALELRDSDSAKLAILEMFNFSK